MLSTSRCCCRSSASLRRSATARQPRTRLTRLRSHRPTTSPRTSFDTCWRRSPPQQTSAAEARSSCPRLQARTWRLVPLSRLGRLQQYGRHGHAGMRAAASSGFSWPQAQPQRQGRHRRQPAGSTNAQGTRLQRRHCLLRARLALMRRSTHEAAIVWTRCGRPSSAFRCCRSRHSAEDRPRDRCTACWGRRCARGSARRPSLGGAGRHAAGFRG